MSATFSITFTQRTNGKWDILRKLSAKNGSQEEIDMAMELNKLIRDKIHGGRRDGEEKRMEALGSLVGRKG